MIKHVCAGVHKLLVRLRTAIELVKATEDIESQLEKVTFTFFFSL
jgi:hypothetical protein